MHCHQAMGRPGGDKRTRRDRAPIDNIARDHHHPHQAKAQWRPTTTTDNDDGTVYNFVIVALLQCHTQDWMVIQFRKGGA